MTDEKPLEQLLIAVPSVEEVARFAKTRDLQAVDMRSVADIYQLLERDGVTLVREEMHPEDYRWMEHDFDFQQAGALYPVLGDFFFLHPDFPKPILRMALTQYPDKASFENAPTIARRCRILTVGDDGYEEYQKAPPMNTSAFAEAILRTGQMSIELYRMRMNFPGAIHAIASGEFDIVSLGLVDHFTGFQLPREEEEWLISNSLADCEKGKTAPPTIIRLEEVYRERHNRDVLDGVLHPYLS